MSPRIRWSILIVALIGLGLSVAAGVVHYRLLTDPSYVSPCDVNATFNCSTAYLSQYGAVAGIPTALGGVLWFGLVALIAAFAASTSGEESPAAAYLFALTLVAAPVVLFLGYVSYARLRVGCPICMGTYVCVLTLLGLTSAAKGVGLANLPGRMASDLGTLKRRPLVFVLVMTFLAGVGALAVWFPREASVAEPVEASTEPPPPADVLAQFSTAWAQQPRVDLGLPADGAKVLVVKFNDFECPACRAAEGFYRPVLAKFEKTHPGQVRFVLKDWAWNISCNPAAGRTIPGHEAACDAAVAARIARDRGKFDEMAAWLYGHQGVTPDAVRAEAGRMLGVTNFEAEYAARMPVIAQDFLHGDQLKINGTPTYFINGVRLPEGQMLAPAFFEYAITLELQRMN